MQKQYSSPTMFQGKYYHCYPTKPMGPQGDVP